MKRYGVNIIIGLYGILSLAQLALLCNLVFGSERLTQSDQAMIRETCRGAHKGCGSFVSGCYEDLTTLMRACEKQWVGRCTDYEPMNKRERLDYCSALIVERGK